MSSFIVPLEPRYFVNHLELYVGFVRRIIGKYMRCHQSGIGVAVGVDVGVAVLVGVTVGV